MAEAFDPYHAWLGIPPAEQPADYYRLLGIKRFESNEAVIAEAAERQTRHIETFKTGPYAKEADRLLKKLATAKACLSDAGKKHVYDGAMRGTLAAERLPQLAADVPQQNLHAAATSPPDTRTRTPLVQFAKIGLCVIAGLVIGNAILWYGFGMDVLNVMGSRTEPAAKPLAQNNADVPPNSPSDDVPGAERETTTKLQMPDPRPQQATEAGFVQQAETQEVTRLDASSEEESADVERVSESQEQPVAQPPAVPSAVNIGAANAPLTPPRWFTLRPTTLEAQHGTQLRTLYDGSVLVSGVSAERNTYVLTATAPLTAITGFQIEALPDASLPDNGPGRAGGNFVLTEFQVFVIESDGTAVPVALQNASASFEQTPYTPGDRENPYEKYVARSAIDGDVKGDRWGWAIRPHVGKPHRMVVQTAQPISGSETKLRINIDQQHGTQHTLGRFRLAVTSSLAPLTAEGPAVQQTTYDYSAERSSERGSD